MCGKRAGKLEDVMRVVREGFMCVVRELELCARMCDCIISSDAYQALQDHVPGSHMHACMHACMLAQRQMHTYMHLPSKAQLCMDRPWQYKAPTCKQFKNRSRDPRTLLWMSACNILCKMALLASRAVLNDVECDFHCCSLPAIPTVHATKLAALQAKAPTQRRAIHLTCSFKALHPGPLHCHSHSFLPPYSHGLVHEQPP